MSSRIITRVVGVGALAAAVLLSSGPTVAAEQKAAASCERACLQKMLDSYLAAVFKHDPGAVPLAADYFATENTAQVAKGDGAWKSVTGYGEVQRRFADQVNSSAAF
ncbi:MAG TPA: hypothetical protein VGC34_10425, partial [Steroidobacteraceae bacterium]